MRTGFLGRAQVALIAATVLWSSTIPVFAQSDTPEWPEGPMTRAEFVAFIVEQTHVQKSIDTCLERLSPSQYTLLFTDVERSHPLAKHLCVALREGVIRGYQDGSFKPGRFITFVEASKVLVRSYDVFPASWYPSAEPWYEGYIRTLEHEGAILPSIDGLLDVIDAQEAMEIAMRLELGIATDSSIGYEEVIRRTNAPAVQRFSR